MSLTTAPYSQRERHAVPGGHDGVGGGRVDLAHAAAGQHHGPGPYGADAVASALAHDVERDPAGAALGVAEEVEGEGVLDDLDAGLGQHRLGQGPLHLRAGRVAARVDDAVAVVAALAGELELAVDVAVELRAVAHQPLQRVGALGDQDAHGLLVAQADPGDERVPQVLVGGVLGVEDGGDAALRPPGRSGRQHILGDHEHPRPWVEFDVAQRHGEAGDPRPDHDRVGFDGPAGCGGGESACERDHEGVPFRHNDDNAPGSMVPPRPLLQETCRRTGARAGRDACAGGGARAGGGAVQRWRPSRGWCQERGRCPSRG